MHACIRYVVRNDVRTHEGILFSTDMISQICIMIFNLFFYFNQTIRVCHSLIYGLGVLTALWEVLQVTAPINRNKEFPFP